MVHETTERDPERIYLEPPPYSPEGRQWCADDVWPLDGDGYGHGDGDPQEAGEP